MKTWYILLLLAFVSLTASASECGDYGMTKVSPQGMVPFCIEIAGSTESVTYDRAESVCAARGSRLCEQTEWVEGTLRIHEMGRSSPYDGQAEWVFSHEANDASRPTCVGHGDPVDAPPPMGNPVCHAGCTSLENRVRCCKDLEYYGF